jgi:hypothetical protein
VPRERIVAGLDDARDVVIGEGPQPQSLRAKGASPKRNDPVQASMTRPRSRSRPGVVPCSVNPVAWATRSDGTLPTWERQWTISTPPSVSDQSTASRTARAMTPRPRAHGCSAKPMSAMGWFRTSTLPANRDRPSSSTVSIAQPRWVPSSQPRGRAVKASCSAVSRVYEGGIAVQRTISGSVDISTSPSTSDGTWALSVTTPSSRTGTFSGHLTAWTRGTDRRGTPRES